MATNRISKLLLYLRTLSYLRFGQVANRVQRLIRRRFFEKSRLLKVSSSVSNADLPINPIEIPRPSTENRPGTIDGNRFSFLNKTLELGSPINWFPEGVEQLWLYNLHYFDYLQHLGGDCDKDQARQNYLKFRDLVTGWLAACPPGSAVAWDPYPISLRLTNWIKAYSWFSAFLDDDPDFSSALRRSLWVQTHALNGQLEYHLLGNHLIENGRALVMAGLFFQAPEAANWLATGKQILSEQLEEQFLGDGAHFERSPMYHQIMLEVYREMGELLLEVDRSTAAEFLKKATGMETWLREVLHPDGRIPLVNDAAFGIAPEPFRQIAPAGQTDGLVELQDSGYFVFRDQAAGDFLIFDAGPIGPDYQPGHGHCDTLSVEISHAGKRFVVDSGVATYYGNQSDRHYYRNTRAHNTLTVDGLEQSEIWSYFRVARRARPFDINSGSSTDLACFAAASHDGYRRLAGAPEHRRWVVWLERRFWIIADEVLGGNSHVIDSRLHFHPAVDLSVEREHDENTSFLATRGGADLTFTTWCHARDGDGRPGHGIEESKYASEFGRERGNRAIRMSYTGRLPIFLGCVASPGRARVSTEVSGGNGSPWRLDVTTNQQVYRLSFASQTVEVVHRSAG